MYPLQGPDPTPVDGHGCSRLNASTASCDLLIFRCALRAQVAHLECECGLPKEGIARLATANNESSTKRPCITGQCKLRASGSHGNYSRLGPHVGSRLLVLGAIRSFHEPRPGERRSARLTCCGRILCLFAPVLPGTIRNRRRPGLCRFEAKPSGFSQPESPHQLVTAFGDAD